MVVTLAAETAVAVVGNNPLNNSKSN